MRRIFLSSAIACFVWACSSGGDSPQRGRDAGGDASSGNSGSSDSGASGTSAGTSGEMDASGGHDASTSHGKDAAAADAGKGIDCDPRRILCKAVETPCPEGQVHEVIDRCYGPCVDITACPCDEAADCPHSETYTCWNSSGYCNYWGP